MQFSNIVDFVTSTEADADDIDLTRLPLPIKRVHSATLLQRTASFDTQSPRDSSCRLRELARGKIPLDDSLSDLSMTHL